MFGIFFSYNSNTGEWNLRKTPAVSTVLATTVIRETLKSVFGGVGVYTVLEIFFKAGELFCWSFSLSFGVLKLPSSPIPQAYPHS